MVTLLCTRRTCLLLPRKVKPQYHPLSAVTSTPRSLGDARFSSPGLKVFFRSGSLQIEEENVQWHSRDRIYAIEALIWIKKRMEDTKLSVLLFHHSLEQE